MVKRRESIPMGHHRQVRQALRHHLLWYVARYRSNRRVLANASPQPSQQTVTQVISSAPLATSALPIPLSEHGQNVGAIAGAVVGGVFGLAIIVGACWFLIHSRHKPPPPPPKPDSRFPLELGSHYLSEAPTYTGDVKRNELPGGPVSRPELSGS